MSSLLIRAEDWDKMAQSGRGSDDAGRSGFPSDVSRPPDVLPAAGGPVDAGAVAELLVVLGRAREAEQQLQTCIEQIQIALQQSRV